MQVVVGVRLKKAGKIYYFSPGNLTLQKGDGVIVETARGMEYGLVVLDAREIEEDDAATPLRVIRRKATADDVLQLEENKKREKEAFAVCEQKISEHGLPMKLVRVEYTFDGGKIVFYFTADGRIDFRDLVKDLAAQFRTRIELRQIGVRDEAKFLGGIGSCGRPLCCWAFLGDFEPVSIRMAKEQNLSLNPTKISGICGRLMCCLKYENECYEGQSQSQPKKAEPPKQGGRVVCEGGEGKVISVNMQRRTVTILLDNNSTVVTSWDDVIEELPDDAAIIADINDSAARTEPTHRSRKRRNTGEGADKSQHGGRPRRGRSSREGRGSPRRERREAKTREPSAGETAKKDNK